MKLVKLTNCTVLPLWKKNPTDPDEVLRVIPPKDATFTSTMVTFRIETQVSDKPNRRARHFQDCVRYASGADEVNKLKDVIKKGALIEIEGREDIRKGKDKAGNDRYFNNIVVETIIPISTSVNKDTNSNPEDDLPF